MSAPSHAGTFEPFGGVVEVDELDSAGQRAGEECLSFRPLGEFDHREVQTLAEHRLDFGGQVLHQKNTNISVKNTLSTR